MNKVFSYILVSAISRSGGTYLKSLFEGVDSFNAFPIEFPTKIGQSVGFVTQREYSQIKSSREWLQLTHLDYHLGQFSRHPYQRAFGRKRESAEPLIEFNLQAFEQALAERFDEFEDVGSAYLETWRAFFRNIYIDNSQYHGVDLTNGVFINHHAKNIVRSSDELLGEKPEGLELFLVHIIREPLENITSLANHWKRISMDPDFYQLALARWKYYLYSILRNKIINPSQTQTIGYSSEHQKVSISYKNPSFLLFGIRRNKTLHLLFWDCRCAANHTKKNEATLYHENTFTRIISQKHSFPK